MRIVAVADTHLFHGGFVVPDGDVFIHAGDMCRGGNLGELKRAASWIASLPHRHKVIVAGNHDWAFVREPDKARALFAGMHYLEDREVAIDGLRFYGSPWQPAFFDWAFNLPRGPALAKVWAKIPHGLDVLITHGPPAGIGDGSMDVPEGAPRIGCADLRHRLAEVVPRLQLFGHIHEDGGAWQVGGTLCVNVTCWECDRAPTVVDVIDGVVTPVAIPAHGRRD